MKPRTLKIETAGDFWRRKVSPKIRLSGRWLEQAGFKPGHRVAVEISQPGTLTLRFLDQVHVEH
ncbi:MAG: SymE family type I addiction module toxin [Verrucomicrobiota bacterium]